MPSLVTVPRGVVVTPADASRRRWLAARKTGLGASDTAAILGLSPYSSALDIWLDKTTRGIPDLAIEAAEWGLAHEATIARKVNTRHRKEIGVVHPSPGLLRHDGHSWMLATPDRLLYLDRGQDWDRSIADPINATALLEIKTSSSRLQDRWADGVPLYYQVQVQQQLAVTGLRVGYLAVLHGGNHMPEPYRIDRDERAIEMIVRICGEWWERHIVKGERPEPTWPADVDNINSLYEVDPSKVVKADDVLSRRIDMLRDAKRRLAQAKEQHDSIAFEVKTALGEAVEVWAGETPLATWKPHTVRNFDVKQFREDHPALALQYMVEGQQRPLRLKKESTDE